MNNPHAFGQKRPLPVNLRNPRRAYDVESYEIEPMTLQQAMDCGVVALKVSCTCGHEAEMPIYIGRWAANSYVPDAGMSLRCEACGKADPQTIPVWPARIKTRLNPL